MNSPDISPNNQRNTTFSNFKDKNGSFQKPRMNSYLKKKQKIKMFGVLGIDPIED